MKQHFYLFDHVWTCRSIDQYGRMFLGHGYDWRTAFKDWQKRVPCGRFR